MNINNYLTIYGNPYIIKKFIGDIDTFCLNKYVSVNDINDKNFKLLNWGTPSDINIITYHKETNYLHFISDTYPPITWLKTVSKQFKNLYFNLVYYVELDKAFNSISLENGNIRHTIKPLNYQPISDNYHNYHHNHNYQNFNKINEKDFNLMQLIGHPFA